MLAEALATVHYFVDVFQVLVVEHPLHWEFIFMRVEGEVKGLVFTVNAKQLTFAHGCDHLESQLLVHICFIFYLRVKLSLKFCGLRDSLHEFEEQACISIFVMNEHKLLGSFCFKHLL